MVTQTAALRHTRAGIWHTPCNPPATWAIVQGMSKTKPTPRRQGKTIPYSPRILSLLGSFGLPLAITASYVHGLGLPPLPVWLVTTNLMMLALLGKDKFAAQRGWDRTPEFTLLALAFAGASPALLIGRKIFNHKTSKQEFIYAMWGTLAVQIGCIYYFRQQLMLWL